MKASRLLHYLLALALCLGQIAAHAHIIDHLHFAANQASDLSKHVEHHAPGEHFGQHSHNHYHSQNHAQNHAQNHKSFEDSSATEVDLDCAAYHAFAGLAGIKATACNVVAVHLSRTLAPTPYPATLHVSSAATQSIRGPPQHS